MSGLEVFGDFFELVDGASTFVVQCAHDVFKAMVNVILDENFFCLRDCLLDGMQLLGKIKARTMLFHHLENASQMPFCALEALGDRVMVMVRIWGSHANHYIPPGRIGIGKPSGQVGKAEIIRPAKFVTYSTYLFI